MRQGTVAKWKTKKVDNLAQIIKEYPTTGIVDIQNLPSKTLYEMKKKLSEDTIVRMTKKSLINRALKENKLEGLTEKLEGQPALILSKKDAFRLARFLNENSSKAPAKPGTVFDEDIIVPAGDTDFAPGPIVSELSQAGIKAAIDRGKVVIKENSPIAKAGIPVTKQQSDAMAKLGIEPMEIKLKILAAYEDGLVYDADVLNISPEQTLADVQNAAARAFNLAFNAEYPTPQNIELFIQKAFLQAKSLATEAEYICSATVKDLLGKATRQMNALKSKVPELPEGGAAEEPAAEEKKEEEKKEEVKPEDAKPKEAKPEEAPAEEKKEEAPAEEKKEESTEAPAEEPKEEEKPAEEAPAEEQPAAEEKIE